MELFGILSVNILAGYVVCLLLLLLIFLWSLWLLLFSLALSSLLSLSLNSHCLFIYYAFVVVSKLPVFITVDEPCKTGTLNDLLPSLTGKSGSQNIFIFSFFLEKHCNEPNHNFQQNAEFTLIEKIRKQTATVENKKKINLKTKTKNFISRRN